VAQLRAKPLRLANRRQCATAARRSLGEGGRYPFFQDRL